jgi:predicted RNA-binding Zn ribbon-like protein
MRFDSGRVCLDLVAAPGLQTRERLVEWLYGAQLVPPGTPIHVREEWLPRFAALRGVVERLLTAELATRAPAAADVAALNEAARGATPAPRAVAGDGGSLTRALDTPPTCDALLAAVARDGVELFTDPPARSRLRRCEGENCAVVYLDTSRGRRRRWCSSEVCGNRERVARHRRRTMLTAPRT